MPGGLDLENNSHKQEGEIPRTGKAGQAEVVMKADRQYSIRAHGTAEAG